VQFEVSVSEALHCSLGLTPSAASLEAAAPPPARPPASAARRFCIVAHFIPNRAVPVLDVSVILIGMFVVLWASTRSTPLIVRKTSTPRPKTSSGRK
jgi:hypothetical protein